MPAYNCEKFVSKAIESILQQSYPNFELLITDDASTDNTRSVIDSYNDKRIKRFHNSENQGYLKASNLLFSKCSGEFITFQDADDYCSSDRLEKLIGYLNAHTNVSVVGSNICKVDTNDNKFWNSNFPLAFKDILKNFGSYKVVFTGSALMIKKEIIKSVGVYNDYFNRLGSEDVYWYSLIIQKHEVSNIPDVLYFYRANPNSVGTTFKDPKSRVLHNLTVKLFQLRSKGLVDPILIGDYKLADKHCEFLILIEDAKKRKLSSIIKSIKLFIFNFNLIRFYSKDLIYSLVKA
jgi:glycosyltransferase involved in cell wall biosynthesis